MVTKGPTYINGNPLALEGPQILLILKHAGGSRNGSLCKRKSVGFGNVALLTSPSIHKSQGVEESCVYAGIALAATEIQPPLGMRPASSGALQRFPFLPLHPVAGSFPHRWLLPALKRRVPPLHCSLSSLKSMTITINPSRLSPFVFWIFFFFSLEFYTLFLPSPFFLFAWKWHLGFVWLFFLYLYSPLT